MQVYHCTIEVFPQLAEISLKVLKLHLGGLEKVQGLRQRVDACLFASILVKDNTHTCAKTHTLQCQNQSFSNGRGPLYTLHTRQDLNKCLEGPTCTYQQFRHAREDV